MTTVWEIGQAGEQDGIHPTQKPRDVFRWPIEWHTRKGEVVLARGYGIADVGIWRGGVDTRLFSPQKRCLVTRERMVDEGRIDAPLLLYGLPAVSAITDALLQRGWRVVQEGVVMERVLAAD